MWASQVKGTTYSERNPESPDDDMEDASEWWRGGGRRYGQQPLMALEVVKPLMAQDLERLSDQVRFTFRAAQRR